MTSADRRAQLGTSCDGGLLSERRAVATAPTLPPPSEPTDEQIQKALVWRTGIPFWDPTPSGNWQGRARKSALRWDAFTTHDGALEIARKYLARRGAK